MGTAHPTGYPTYVLLGWLGNLLLTPIGEPAFRVTALSLIAVAVAAGATVALVRRLTGSTIIAAAAGIGLATTRVVWLNATRADPHAIHLAFVAVLFLALVRWSDGPKDGLDRRAIDRRLVLAAVIFGLAVGNHSLTLLLVPPIALYVLATEPGILRRPRLLGASLGAAALTIVAGLPGAADPRRPAARPADLWRAGDVGRLLVHRAGGAVPRLPRQRVRRPPGESSTTSFGVPTCGSVR